MTRARFKIGDVVQLKGGTRKFTVKTVTCVIECIQRPSGFYYTGDLFDDIFEDRLALVYKTPNPQDFKGEPSKERFSENVRHLLESRGIDFTEFSRSTGVPRSSCYDAAYRGLPTKFSTIANIASFFNVLIDDIVYRDLSKK